MSRRIAAVICMLGFSASCSSDNVVSSVVILPVTPVSSQVATVVVTPETSVLTVGGTLQLVASTRDVGGAPLIGRVVAWSSDAPDIATVSSAGVVTAIAPGLVRLSALSEGRTGTASITAVR
jgi:trimeric autotransporter adhesin